MSEYPDTVSSLARDSNLKSTMPEGAEEPVGRGETCGLMSGEVPVVLGDHEVRWDAVRPVS